MSDPTLDPQLESWIPVPDGSDFPVQNLPFGVFSARRRSRRLGVAVGDHIVDLDALAAAGLFAGTGATEALREQTLNAYLALGPGVWTPVRAILSDLLSGAPPEGLAADAFVVPTAEASLHLPAAVGDYVDFYSSLEHATNLGRMFRPNEPPLLPNWRHLPVGYHGRASSIVPSGADVVRPSGQRPGPHGTPTFGPSEKLDIELEVGFLTGPGNDLGTAIAADEAEGHIFGLVLVNDWSARDIQAWEYRPLGPFLGKSFSTTISPWVVQLDALAPFRVDAPAQDPAPLAYLRPTHRRGVDVELSVELNGFEVARTNLAGMYWTMAQQLAHTTVNGTNVRPGDLYASGTISGRDETARGSFIEITWNGTRPLQLPDGSRRTFLEDGDRVVLRGTCRREGYVSIGFGECAGTVVAAPLTR